MPAVFLAHSSTDKGFVRWLASRLKENGVRYWLDEAELRIGDSLIGRIGEAIDECDFCAVVLSSSSVKSEWVQRELRLALNKEFASRKVVVLPLLLEKVAIPPFLRDKVHADFSADEKREESFRLLLERLGVQQVAPAVPGGGQEHVTSAYSTEAATERERIETDFSAWMQHSDERWRLLVGEKLPAEHPARLVRGYWSAAYWLLGEFERPSGQELRDTLERIQGRETGWPVWIVMDAEGKSPHPQDGLVECWLSETVFEEPGYCDFWRASPDGKMFLRRGYQEDGIPEKVEPGSVLDFTLPVWRMGECMLNVLPTRSECLLRRCFFGQSGPDCRSVVL